MPNRTVSLALLLFSFAVTLMAFQPPVDAPLVSYSQRFHVVTATLPVLAYRILGAVATAGSLFFILLAFRKRWSERVEYVVTNSWNLHYLGFCGFWSVYAITYLKGVGAVVAISPPAWVVYLVFYFGFALFLAIPVLSFMNRPAGKKTP